MNRYYTLTLNPALDRTMYFDTFVPGALNRAVSPSQLTLGSKGINVSRFLAVCGAEAPAYGFWGGAMGEQMLAMLHQEGIETRFVQTAAETRLNIKIITPDGTGTEANERGGPITEAECEILLNALTEQAKRDQNAGDTAWLFLGGSIPQGVDKNVYNLLVEKMGKLGVRTVLDCDGEALKQGVASCPYLIKPNLFELSQFAGAEIRSPEQAVEISGNIYRETKVRVLCTMGGQGALYAGPEGIFTVDAPHVTVRGFTGAGDTFLAAFIFRRANGDSVSQALAFAAGAAAAKVEMPGSTMPALPDAQRYAAQRHTEAKQ